MLLAAILWYLPEFIFRCLPLSFKSKVRFGRRYAVKSGLGIEQKTELGITELKSVYKQRKKKTNLRFQGGPERASPLSDFLSVYDMLLTVAEYLHYSDILSLSLVSISVREAVLPANDFDRRTELFQRYTCPGTKSLCWMCDTQICTVSFPSQIHFRLTNYSPELSILPDRSTNPNISSLRQLPSLLLTLLSTSRSLSPSPPRHQENPALPMRPLHGASERISALAAQ
jgi:hypothetical protein